MTIPEVIQQTLFMPVKDLSPCTETSEEGEENYIQTNFDEMVSDFCEEITKQGYVPMSRTFSIAEGIIIAIIQYVNPVQIQEAYRKAVATRKSELKLRCGQYKIDYVEADIKKGYHQVLTQYLIKRNRLY